MRIQKNYQILGVCFSSLLHLIFTPLIVYSTSTITQRSKTIVLDFNLENVIKTGEHHTDTRPIKATEVMGKPVNVQSMTTKVVAENSTVNDNKIINYTSKDKQPFEEMINKVSTASYSDIDDLKHSIKDFDKNSVDIIEKNQLSPSSQSNTNQSGNVNTAMAARQNNIAPPYDKPKPESEPDEQTYFHQGQIAKKQEIMKKNHITTPLSLPSQDADNEAVDVEQSAENQYIKENFDYISKIIRINISYPYKARKMAMEGNVLISFIISLDGSAKDIKIEKSSGFVILDKNAEKAIRNASPFPPPPVEAKIEVPVTYKLN
jgi:periplasmic protein TonB